MEGTRNRRITRGEARKAEKRKAEQERMEREAKQFAPDQDRHRHPNDLRVDRNLGKIKVEETEEEQVKPDVEDEVNEVTVKEEVDVEDAPFKSVFGLAATNLETSELAKTVVEQRLEIESLRKQLNEASGRLEVADIGTSKLTAENEALRQEVKSLKEVIVDQCLEIQKLRKECTKENDQVELPVETKFATDFDQVDPFLLPFLNLNSILKCRLVCHNWKLALDSSVDSELVKVASQKGKVENESSSEESNMNRKRKIPVDHLPFPVHQLKGKFSFSDLEQIGKFKEYATQCHGNPFFGHCATFKVTKETLNWAKILKENGISEELMHCNLASHPEKYEDYSEMLNVLKEVGMNFWKQVGNLVTKYGEHLWHVTLIQEDCGLTPRVLQDILVILLPHVPNLKTLSMDVTFMKMMIRNRKLADWNWYRSGGKSAGSNVHLAMRISVKDEITYRMNLLEDWLWFNKESFALRNLETIRILVNDTFFKDSNFTVRDNEGIEYEYINKIPRRRMWRVCPNLKAVNFEYYLKEEIPEKTCDVQSELEMESGEETGDDGSCSGNWNPDEYRVNCVLTRDMWYQ